MNKLRATLGRAILSASLMVGVTGCNWWGWWRHDDAAPPETKAVVLSPATLSTEATQRQLRTIVGYLASDELEGRGIDTPGIEKAAAYIRNKLVATGLRKAPGMDGYFQEFDYTTVSAIGPGTALKSGGAAYELNRDYTVVSSSGEGTYAGDVVFAGYGISSKEEKYDDFDGVDVKGKVVLILRFEPHDAKGNSRFAKQGWSTNAHLRSKFKACTDQGAAAVLLVNPVTYHPGDLLMPFARAYQEGAASIPVMQVTQKVAGELLKRGGLPDLKTLQGKIDETGKPASVALKGVRVEGKVELARQTRKLKNVVAMLPGEGANADEYVVVGAHYDHLGHGGPGSLYSGRSAIHHGADDNASGTAALIATAERMAHGPRPDRSVIFVAFTAEESGLIGSQRFVNNPPVPLSDVVGMLNMDMVGRIREDTLYIGGAGTAAPFEEMLKQADEDSPLGFKDFGKGGYGPSDHMSFAMKKVPVLFLFSGMHADYHRPSDTADKINYAGLAEVTKVAGEIVMDMARMPKSPYVASADAANPHAMSSVGNGTGSRVSLGVIPDYGTDISKGGVRITGTSPGTPAEKAGLKEGDVIVGFGSKKVDNLYDLTDALSSAEAGQTVTVKFIRGGKEMAASATLVERGG